MSLKEKSISFIALSLFGANLSFAEKNSFTPWHISYSDLEKISHSLEVSEKNSAQKEWSNMVLLSAIRFPCYLLNKIEEKKCKIEQSKIIKQNDLKLKRNFLTIPKEIFYSINNHYIWLSEELQLELKFSEPILKMERERIRPLESKWEILTSKTKLRLIWFEKIPPQMPSELFLKSIEERLGEKAWSTKVEKIIKPNFREGYLFKETHLATQVFVYRRNFDTFLLILEGDQVEIRNLI